MIQKFVSVGAYTLLCSIGYSFAQNISYVAVSYSFMHKN